MEDHTPKQASELHQALLSLQAELQKLLEDSSDGAKPVSLEEPIGRLSRMDALQGQAMAQAVGDKKGLQRSKPRCDGLPSCSLRLSHGWI